LATKKKAAFSGHIFFRSPPHKKRFPGVKNGTTYRFLKKKKNLRDTAKKYNDDKK